MRRLLLCLCLALVAFAGVPVAAEACKCTAALPLCEAVPKANVVFEGTVESIEAHSSLSTTFGGGAVQINVLHVRFRNIKSLKGEPHSLVLTGMGGGDCGYPFIPGERYVVAASRRPDGSLSTGICSLTQPIEEADALLSFLQSLSTPGSGGTISGSVAITRGLFERLPLDRVPNARVTLRGPVSRLAVTDAEGEFAWSNLPAGYYFLTTQPPEERSDLIVANARATMVRLMDAHSCVTLNYLMAFDGAIEGTVVDAEGRGAPAVTVHLRPAQHDPSSAGRYSEAETDSEGLFRFKQLPPGEYVVGVNLRNGPTLARPFALAYVDASPGRPAGTVELGAGQKQQLPPLMITRVALSRVVGQVLLPDGLPAARVEVSAAPMGEDRDSPRLFSDARTVTDDEGAFAIELFEGATYTLFSRRAGMLGITQVVAGDGQAARISFRLPDRYHSTPCR